MASTLEPHVAPTNVDQLRAWDGDEGTYWAEHTDHFDRSSLPFHERLLRVAAVGPDEHVLDVGCGAGQSTILAARAAARGFATGVDLSSPMLARARERARAEAVPNVSFEHGDAQVHSFAPASVDVVISNMGAMFFGDLVAGFANLGHALRPGGRLAVQTWQAFDDNEWIRELRGALAVGRDFPAPPQDAPTPFALADPDRVHRVLGDAGFSSVDVVGARQPMWFGADADDACDFVLGQLGWMLRDLDEPGRDRARDALHATTAAHATAEGVLYDSAIWVVTATRR